MKKNDEIDVRPNKLETMEDKKVVAITDDELDGATGGTFQKAFTCPVCKASVPISLYDLMSSSRIFCPKCRTAFETGRMSASLPDIDSLTRN